MGGLYPPENKENAKENEHDPRGGMAEVRTLQDHYRNSIWEETTNHQKEADGGIAGPRKRSLKDGNGRIPQCSRGVCEKRGEFQSL